MTFFTVYHKVKMLTDLGVLFTVFFLTKPVDNVTLLYWLMQKKDDIHCEMIFAHNVSLLSVIPGCILPSFK